MKLHWRLTLREGLLTGLIFCIGIMAVLRVNPVMFASDFPDPVEKELLSMEFSSPTFYEYVLSIFLVLGPLWWGGFRLLSKLKPKILEEKKGRRILIMYLHLAIWQFIVSNSDLLILDWLIIGVFKAPILGFEHTLSAEAVRSYQSYYFHFEEHYLFYGTYLVHILTPLLILGVFGIYEELMKLVFSKKAKLTI